MSQWPCSNCTFNNDTNKEKCSMCDNPRPSIKYIDNNRNKSTSYYPNMTQQTRKRTRQTSETSSIFNQLTDMGFNQDISEKAASHFPTDISAACEYIESLKNEQCAKQMQINDDLKLAQQISSQTSYNSSKCDAEPALKRRKISNLNLYDKYLKSKEHNTISGLYYIPNFVDQEEQQNVLKAAKFVIDKQFISYSANGDERYYCCNRLARNITELLKANGLMYTKKNNIFDNILMRNYQRGDKLKMHYDDKVRYGKLIAGISFGSAATIRFRKKQNGTYKDQKVRLEPGSLFIMTGDSRYDYQHGFEGGDIFGSRTSLTFRWNTGAFVDTVPKKQSGRARGRGGC